MMSSRGPSSSNPKWVHWNFNEGAGVTISSTGYSAPFPDLTLNGTVTVLWNNAGKITTDPATGNRTTRVFANAVIDDLCRSDDMVGKWRCKWINFQIIRDTVGFPIAAAERLWQYGDQGTSATQTGGGVMRLNVGDTVTAAWHSPDVTGKTKAASQDAQYTSGALTLSTVTSILQLMDNSGVNPAVRLYVNGTLNGSAVFGSNATASATFVWPLAGPSTSGPGSDATSNGFVLFNQSVNQTASPLLACIVNDVQIGQAMDTSHAAQIASALNLDPTAFPY